MKGNEPFFMLFSTGITHHPYNPTPRGAERKPIPIILVNSKKQKRKENFDGLLNSMAYSGKFIATIFST
jgi:hypothetical protein